MIYFSESGFLPTFIMLIVFGCILTFSQFLCASVCSAITASLVGVAKSVLQTIIGFFTFGGVRFHPLNILGLILNTIGGALYSYVKYQEGEHKKRQLELKEKHPSMVSLLSKETTAGAVPNGSTGYHRRHRGSITSTEETGNEESDSNGIWINNNLDASSIKYVDERN